MVYDTQGTTVMIEDNHFQQVLITGWRRSPTGGPGILADNRDLLFKAFSYVDGMPRAPG